MFSRQKNGVLVSFHFLIPAQVGRASLGEKTAAASSTAARPISIKPSPSAATAQSVPRGALQKGSILDREGSKCTFFDGIYIHTYHIILYDRIGYNRTK